LIGADPFITAKLIDYRPIKDLEVLVIKYKPVALINKF